MASGRRGERYRAQALLLWGSSGRGKETGRKATGSPGAQEEQDSSPGLESHEIVSGGPRTPCSPKHQALCGWFPFSTPQPFLMPLALPPPLPPFPQQGAAPRGHGRRLWRGEVGGGSSFLRRAQPLLRVSAAGPLQIRGLRVQHILPYGLGQGWG